MAASNLKVRLLTAAVVVPPLMWLLFLGPAYGFFLLVLFAAAVAADELFRMTHPNDLVARVVGIVTTLAVSASLYLWGTDPRVLLTLLFVVPLLGLMIPLWRLGDIPTAALRTFAGVTGPLYIGGLLTALALLRRDAGAVGPHYVFMCLTFAWLADTGGYFFGRFLGKRKLYEAVSPKKTRAGFVGALVGAELGGLLGHFFYLRSIPLSHVVPLALVAGALGQGGDLVESLLKRSTGIKDSGSIVPGHGGMLDRIDALIIVAPIVYLYVLWVGVGA
ncbi:MAG TPA: phosphatidate cytidylyltransferase [Polyangiaceae bacterium]|nr:phosphatidate cytidylyltransferase [Polyangiaceae bacterium]